MLKKDNINEMGKFLDKLLKTVSRKRKKKEILNRPINKSFYLFFAQN